MKFPRTGADDFLLMREVLLVSGYKLGILQHAQSTPRYPQLTLSLQCYAVHLPLP
jgi:hypothetical protein